MGPYYIQPGTPVYFKYTTFSNLPSTCTGYLTFHGLVKSDTGSNVAVAVPSMNNKTFVTTHSALTYDDTPKPSPLLLSPLLPSLLMNLFLKAGDSS